MTRISDVPSCVRSSRRRGFALPDLLVVLVTGAILVCFLLLARSLTKHKGTVSTCLNNSRQLITAWSLYAADHEDQCVNNYDPALILEEIKSGKLRNWANNVMTWGVARTLKDKSNTNADWLKNGALRAYTQAGVQLYKCPADVFLSDRQKEAGWMARLRSVSMSAYLGPYSDALNEKSVTRNRFDTAYSQFRKLSGIPQPAMTFVMIDENPNSINDGWYLNTRGSAKGWNDVPASYHDGAGVLSFADGHAESHQWLGCWMNDAIVKTVPNRDYRSDAVKFSDAQGRQDFDWLWARTSVPFNPPQPEHPAN